MLCLLSACWILVDDTKIMCGIFCNEQSHHCEVSEIETASFKITGFGKEKSKLKWIYTAAHRNF